MTRRVLVEWIIVSAYGILTLVTLMLIGPEGSVALKLILVALFLAVCLLMFAVHAADARRNTDPGAEDRHDRDH